MTRTTAGAYLTTLTLSFVLANAIAILLLAPAIAVAAEAPVKEVLSSHIGWEVDKATKENICTVASKHECQFGAQSSEPGGFRFPGSLAVDNAPALVSPQHGDVYVADTANQRIQVFSPNGAFLFMFGTEGTGAGQFEFPMSVAIDPATGNVYVEDFLNWRVEEFTATGEFVLAIGKEVNETKDGAPGATVAEKNLCTAESHDKCKAGERAAEGSTEPSAFSFHQGNGGLLQVGGPKGLLYVGDERRIETFKTDGEPEAEISLASISSEPNSAVLGLAVDQAGDIYVVYSIKFVSNVIYELNPSGEQIKRFELNSRRPEANVSEVAISAIALDAAGRLVVSERERGHVEGHEYRALRGVLYEVGATSLRTVTEFNNEYPAEFETANVLSIAFNAEGAMYGLGANELASYVPLSAGELTTGLALCKSGADDQTDATVECELKGKANPWGILGTEVWFQWGGTSLLGSETAPLPLPPVESTVNVSSSLTGLLPNETYYYREVGEDEHVKSPEVLTSERTSVTTEAAAPRIVGAPSVPHVGPFSAMMVGELNPENSETTFEFQYGACEDLNSCAQRLETPPANSPTYGVIGTAVEVSGLLPGTLYHYRLVAKSQGGEARSSAGVFTTDSAPAVSAETGLASNVGATSAVISGVVNPDGQAATYTFELGLYNGTETQFGIVSSASAGSGATAIEKSLVLTGLQPGMRYAYRIAVHSGDGSAKGALATGVMLTFTTEGLPSVLAVPLVLGQLTVPNIAFPKEAVIITKKLTRAQQLARALRACAMKSKSKRSACKRNARKRYAVRAKSKK
jgi:hypothetical protein